MSTSTDIPIEYQTGRKEISGYDNVLRSRPAGSKGTAKNIAISNELREDLPYLSTTEHDDVSNQASSAFARVLSPTTRCIRKERRRLFPSIEYASRVSHFDPTSDHRDFQGFYVLFWVALTIMVITTVLRNVKDTGYPVRVEIWRLFTVKVMELAIADGCMILTTSASLLLHQIFQSKLGKRLGLHWNLAGMIIQSFYQSIWFTFWVAIPFLQNWTWTAQVFLTLHTFVLLMKMHSYAFYNGHLYEAERKLRALDELALVTPEAPLHAQKSEETENSWLREDLKIELTSLTGKVTYPSNLTWKNYVDYLFCPTLCYELEYPRTGSEIVLTRLAYKVLAVFGVIFLLTITSEEFIVPVLAESAARLETVSTFPETALILAETISMLLFPFMITFLLVFLIIFEYVLGAFAEITCFADRHFYSDWWNSTDWMEFSRKWNIPVHHFFRRHVYSASSPHIGRRMATYGTFILSSLGHEIVMACITKKIRGYGFLLQMSQLPIVVLQRTKWMKDKKVLNNVCFWCSIIFGLSMICSLYVLC